MMTKNKETWIQTAIMGVIVFIMMWAGNYIFNSPDKARADVSNVDDKINSTNQRVSVLEANSRNVEAWLSRVEGKLDKVISK